MKTSRPLKGRKPRNDAAGWPAERGRAWRRWVIRGVVIIAFIAFMSGVAYVVNKGVDWYEVRATTTTSEAEVVTKSVTVSPGMTAAQVGQVLEEAGVIEAASEFVDLVKSRGTENALLPGEYDFGEGLALLEVVDMLERGEGAATFKVTIPEGLAASQVAGRLTDAGDIPGDQYLALSKEPGEFELPEVGGAELPELTTLEGLLFPSTYWLIAGDGARQLMGAQIAAFTQKTSGLPWENAEELGMTPYEIVIIASLIEKEVSVPEERPLVAAVIYNRLAKKMTLGIDATVRYALDKWTGELTTEDLEVDSPYNTRVVKGLPPTPISNPGVAALEAALQPADVDYLYYVLSDTEGNHFFTADYDEFVRAKEEQPGQ